MGLFCIGQLRKKIIAFLAGNRKRFDYEAPSLAKAIVMFIDETLYDDAFFKKIFTDATPHHNSSPEIFFFIYVVFILIKKTMYERLGKSTGPPLPPRYQIVLPFHYFGGNSEVVPSTKFFS